VDPDLRFSEFATVTLTLLGSPYVANTDFTVPAGKTLVVEPGVTIKFKNNYSRFFVDGTLNAVGQSSKQIVFTNDTGNTNPWCALTFSSTSTNSILEYVIVDHAGTTASSCPANSAYPIFVDGSSVTFKNSFITTGAGLRKMYLKNSNSLIDGSTFSGASFNADSASVYISGGAPTIQNSTFSSNSIGIYNQGNPTISNNTFTGNTYPVRLNVISAALSGNTATGNTYNGTFLDDAGIQNITLQADTMPYIMNSFTVQAGKTLTLQAGVVIKFVKTSNDPPAELVVEGTLLANGTSESKVVFTVLDSTPNWKGVRFQAGSAGSLQNAGVEYGGAEINGGAISVENTATLQLQGVAIRNSVTSGLKTNVATTAAVSGSSILFQDNQYAMYIVGACPAFSQVTGASFNPAGVVNCSF
jgi:parallel beta-helix repeat protein